MDTRPSYMFQPEVMQFIVCLGHSQAADELAVSL
jgi:hypothetical protein